MPHTLLLADDSVTIQRVIELTFADEDIRVIAVSDGDQAIAALDQTPPDIVLADVGMPGRTGYEVAQHIRQHPKLSHVPVLLLTGAFEPVDETRAAQVGASGVLTKPFEPQFVINRVRELLSSGRPAAQPPAAEQPAAPSSTLVPREAIPSAKPAAPQTAVDIDTYFDRLDQAFSGLGADRGTPAETPIQARTASTDAAPDLPLSYGSPESAFERLPALISGPPAAEPTRQPEHAAPSSDTASSAVATMPEPDEPAPIDARSAHGVAAPSPAPATGTFPPLAEVFSTLLAAEQGAPAPGAAPAWPASPANPPAAAAVDVDEIATRVKERVLAELTDRAVREAVAEIVSATAERLIREEIERLKARIQ